MRLRRVVLFLLASTTGLAVLVGAWLIGRDLRHYAGPAEPSLSATGLYADIASLTLAADVAMFEPQHELWSDGALKRRYIFIPEGARIDTSNPEQWNFPVGTRLWKEFERDGVVVETRMLLKTGSAPADWDMAVYLWREDRSDADKLAFSRANAGGTAHDVPGPRLCLECHGSANERRPLGFTLIQLPWEARSLLSVSQLIAENRLSHPPSSPAQTPHDELTRSAIGYLHANCGSCHYDGSTAVPEQIALRLALSLRDQANPEQTDAFRTTIDRRPEIAGLGTEFIITPGDPEQSFLWRRMRVRDGGAWQMPPLASEVVDERGVQLIRDWIAGLDEAAAEESETAPGSH